MSLIAWAGAAFAPKEKLVSLLLDRFFCDIFLLSVHLRLLQGQWLVVGQEDRDAEEVEGYRGTTVRPVLSVRLITCEWAVNQCLCLYWSLTVIVYVLNSRIPKQRQRSLFPSMWERRASWATSRGWNKLVARGHQWTMNITELLPTVLSHMYIYIYIPHIHISQIPW